MKTLIKILISIILAIVILSVTIIATVFIVRKNMVTNTIYIHTTERDITKVENGSIKVVDNNDATAAESVSTPSTKVTESIEVTDTVKTDTITKERVGFSNKVMLYDDNGIQYSISIDKITKQKDGTYRFELHIYMLNATSTNYGFTYESVFMNGSGNTQVTQTMVLYSSKSEELRNVDSDNLKMSDGLAILDFTMKCYETMGSGKVLFRNHYIIYVDTDNLMLKIA